ncbi:hypothetical protein K435DRAFT_856184 [Dendrothele bispora CBS 962.96]|uniref:Uncharacterized protein n=1 Tax=Dendrothele bispora (strain CBS 962.96) TaxID=1314807 RepID=A0A4S8M8Y9_DENBC|nr:hypothetical protein K435DRAFT_856184 [Dendrothele bispora CBS 962.96]
MSDEPLQSVLTSDDAFGVETIIVTESIEGLLYGLEFFLTFCTGYLLVRQGVRNSTARFFLLIAIAIMLVDSTAVFAGNIVFGVVQIKGLQRVIEPAPLQAIVPAGQVSGKKTVLCNTSSSEAPGEGAATITVARAAKSTVQMKNCIVKLSLRAIAKGKLGF